MPETQQNHISMTLDSVLPSVETVEKLAEDFAKRAGFDEDTASQIAMVCREAAVNAVLHGNKQNPEKHVEASFDLNDQRLAICIADQGEGLNPNTLPDPLSPENILKPSGRGIFLMKAIMDEVKIRQLSPGTEMTLIKNRAAAQERG